MRGTANRSIRLDTTRCVQTRTAKGLSRERLASDSRGGLSVATIKRLEKGDAVYFDTARRYAELLGGQLQDLALLRDEEWPATAESPAIIAVLPFEVFDPDDQSRCLADGLVEDLITRLGRQWFPVISRGSTFRYRDTHPDAKQIGSELGADYIIEGSVRRFAAALRITVRLTETQTARQIWANAFDCAYEKVFSLQDGIVSTIIGHADRAILDKECRSLLQKDPTDMTAWELSLRGSWCFHRRTRDGNAEAQAYFQRALKRDPMLPLAWYFLAITHQRNIINQWSSDLRKSLLDLKGVCAEFGRHHPSDPGLHIASAYADIYSGSRQSASMRLREAIELDPNATAAYSLYGQALAMGNEPDEAIEQFEVAIRLSPRDSELWSIRSAMALCHFVAERYEDMLHWAELAVQSRPGMPFPYGAVAVARTCLADADGATQAVKAMLEIEPGTSVHSLAAVIGATNPEISARYLDALRRAGVPS